MIGATTGVIGAYLPDAAAREIFARRSRVDRRRRLRTRAAARCSRDGGYRVSGRWPFASGCQHCSWLLGGCLSSTATASRAARRRHARRAHDDLPRRPGAHHRHLERLGPARHRQPRHRGRATCSCRATRSVVVLDATRRSAAGRCTPSRCSACSRSASPRSRSASPARAIDEFIALAGSEDADRQPPAARRALGDPDAGRAGGGAGSAPARALRPRDRARGLGRRARADADRRSSSAPGCASPRPHGGARGGARRRPDVRRPAAAPRSTPTARCSAASATSTSRRST